MSAVQVLSFDEVDEEVFTRWDITRHQLNRHLLSQALTGTPDVVVDFMTFPPGFVHRMHRHPHADQFMVPLTGSIQFLGVPGPAVQFGPGQLLLVPRGNWHEVSNISSGRRRLTARANSPATQQQKARHAHRCYRSREDGPRLR